MALVVGMRTVHSRIYLLLLAKCQAARMTPSERALMRHLATHLAAYFRTEGLEHEAAETVRLLAAVETEQRANERENAR